MFFFSPFLSIFTEIHSSFHALNCVYLSNCWGNGKRAKQSTTKGTKVRALAAFDPLEVAFFHYVSVLIFCFWSTKTKTPPFRNYSIENVTRNVNERKSRRLNVKCSSFVVSSFWHRHQLFKCVQCCTMRFIFMKVVRIKCQQQQQKTCLFRVDNRLPACLLMAYVQQ